MGFNEVDNLLANFLFIRQTIVSKDSEITCDRFRDILSHLVQ